MYLAELWDVLMRIGVEVFFFCSLFGKMILKEVQLGLI